MCSHNICLLRLSRDTLRLLHFLLLEGLEFFSLFLFFSFLFKKIIFLTVEIIFGVLFVCYNLCTLIQKFSNAASSNHSLASKCPHMKKVPLEFPKPMWFVQCNAHVYARSDKNKNSSIAVLFTVHHRPPRRHEWGHIFDWLNMCNRSLHYPFRE